MRTDGHTVLVTGGTRGIGLAIAETFAAAGNGIVIVGSSEESIAKVLDSHPEWMGYACNLADGNDRDSLLKKLMERHADLSVVINNAGIQDDDAASQVAGVHSELHRYRQAWLCSYGRVFERGLISNTDDSTLPIKPLYFCSRMYLASVPHWKIAAGACANL
ncbi:SDR family NAD(P)-dependent oxidoreductase [Congregibacter sp.]|uniref:SDR family NAD(P)-dependent oxidoreductase n=1 Tax=Congregibacter sp. TaxID=2744308 RepID=UPI003F6BEA82